VCKVRGISLNYAATLIVNFDAMRDMILDSADRVITVRTDRKITLKTRRSEGTGLLGSDAAVVV
jgi:hypothetical protein